MQPTTLCNLDCAYCYLPFRSADQRMPVEVAAAVAAGVDSWARTGRFSVVWHGGEPLAAGRDHLAALFAPFGAGVEHHVQTNATLIDDAWCEFFVAHQVRVSVSVDGPRARNGDRVTRGGKPAYDRILKGIAALRRHGIPFSALCVVGDPRPGVAAELYGYFLELGCEVLGINVEELEGVNTRANRHAAADVTVFWAELVARVAHAIPRIHLREVEWCLRYAGAVLDGTADEVLPRQLDPIPTIAHDGSVVLLSPELAGFHRSAVRRFHQRQRADHPVGRDPGAGGRDAVDRRVPARCGGLPGDLPVLRFLRRCARGQPLLRARPVRRHRDRPLPKQQDSPTGGSAGPCPRS